MASLLDQFKFFDGELTLSKHLDYFQNGDDYYVYHNLYGFTLKMSEDVLEFLEYFREKPRNSAEMFNDWAAQFSDELLTEFINVFEIQRCLIQPDEDEWEKVLPYYPVHAKWTIYHQPAQGQVKLFALNRAQGDEIFVLTLNDWESHLWRMINGEKTCKEIIEAMEKVEGSPTSGLKTLVLTTLAKWTHSDLQMLKLSAKPMSAFSGKKRYTAPPYLLSIMPYPKITAKVRGMEQNISFPGLKREKIDAEWLRQDRDENTLSFLFKAPHVAMGGESYGSRLIHYLLSKEDPQAGTAILEVGQGHWPLALNILETLKQEDPERYRDTIYVLLTQDEKSLELIRAKLKAHPGFKVVLGNVLNPQETVGSYGPFDLIISNEFIASLETVSVRKIEPEIDEEEEEEEEANGKRVTSYMGEGDSVNLIFKYQLPLQDAPADFMLNTGAIRLLEKLTGLLSPHGQLAIVEFGEQYRYPVPATDGNRSSFSIHFNILIHVAKKLGYDTEFHWLMEALEFNREVQVFGSSQSHYKALRHMLKHFGVELPRRAFTQEEFEAFLKSHGLNPEEFHDFEYDDFENRVLGLIPHSLKLLRIYKKTEESDLELI